MSSPIVNNKNKIINIVRRALCHIDPRLIDHGERVAFIADRIAAEPGCPPVDREKLIILSLLHDIGAYKTEEIDNMVYFETGAVLNHAVYGYAFLSNTTELGDAAEAILYHHTYYDKLCNIDTAYKTEAELIFLADRIDILLLSPNGPNWDLIKSLSGTAFSPELVELFFRAERLNGISEKIASGAYMTEVEYGIHSLNLTDEAVFGYLMMLVYSIDFRSPFTVTHTANTTAISAYTAELLHLSEEERITVMQGAFLHDIGKIAIPYSILENPGKLTDEEMAVMRTHVGVSEDILRDVVSNEVCEIAIRHHEKLNGRGYHRGLTEKDLTLPQCIVAVSDILSALINKRSYKEPFPKEKAIGILASMRDAGELSRIVADTVIENYDSIIERSSASTNPAIELYEKIQSVYAHYSKIME